MIERPSNPLLPAVGQISESQHRIINAPLQGELVVGGVAGSGKTVAALLRAANLCRNTNPRSNVSTVLFLCYNRALVDLIRQMLLQLPAEVNTRIEVRTAHQWCWNNAIKHDYQEWTVVDDCKRLEFVRAAMRDTKRERGEHEVLARDARILLDEIHLIKGCGFADPIDYLDSRVSRVGALTAADYQLIFTVAPQKHPLTEVAARG